MNYQDILDAIRKQGSTDNADREKAAYNIPGFSPSVQVMPNGMLNYADPSKPGWNLYGTGSPNDYSYEQKNGIDPDFIKFALASGALATGFGTGLLGGSSGAAINPAMHFSDAAFEAGLPGAASSASGVAGGVGLGGAGGLAGQAGDYGLGPLGSQTATDTDANTGGSIFSNIGDAAKGILGNAGGVAALGGLLGGLGSKGPDSQTVTNQNKLDPRMDQMLYGQGGILGRVNGLLDTPQKTGMSQFGNSIDSYLGSNGAGLLGGMMGTAGSLQNSSIPAPQINAPSQNDLNLAPAFQQMIYGNPAENPYLTGAIQKGINQSNNAFQNMMTDATRNLTQNVLPSIRSGEILNGQYGGSRQGIAEGKALGQYGTDLARAIGQFGQNNTDAAVGAQAGAFSQGQDRALSAMSGLGGQQYGTATNNAQFQLGTNQLNSANKIAGLNAGSGLLGQAYGYGTNNDAYQLNKTGQVSSMLYPYTGLGGTASQTQPLYHNTASGILGGAISGLGLWNAMQGKNGSILGNS